MTRTRGVLLSIVVVVAGVLLLGRQAVVAAEKPKGKQPGAQASPSDKPPVAKQPAAKQPAVKQPTAKQPAGPAVTTSAGCACRVCYCCCCGRHRRARCCVVTYCCPCQAATQSTARQAAANPDRYAWKDLFDGKTLAGWKVTDFGGQGKVEVKDGTIAIPTGNDMTGVTWAGGKLPRDNYELTLEGMRVSGSDFFCTTTFPVGKEPCTLVVGGWGGTVVGLSNVDGYDASNNSTSTFQTFKDKQWYRVRIRVTDAKIEAWIGDEKVVNQERKDHKFGIRFECDLCQPLGIATWCTSGAVRNIRLRQLPPDEIKASAEAEKK